MSKDLTIEDIQKIARLISDRKDISMYDLMRITLFNYATGKEKSKDPQYVFNLPVNIALELVTMASENFSVRERTVPDMSIRNIYRALNLPGVKSTEYTMSSASVELGRLAPLMVRDLIEVYITSSELTRGMEYKDFMDWVSMRKEDLSYDTLDRGELDKKLYDLAEQLLNTVNAYNVYNDEVKTTLGLRKTAQNYYKLKKLVISREELSLKIPRQFKAFDDAKIIRDARERIILYMQRFDTAWIEEYKLRVLSNDGSYRNMAFHKYELAKALYKEPLDGEAIRDALRQIAYENEYDDLTPKEMHDAGLRKDIIDSYMVQLYLYNQALAKATGKF